MDTIRHVAALPVIDGRDRERADRLSYIAMSSFVLEAEFAAVRREAEVEMKNAVEDALNEERTRIVSEFRERIRHCSVEAECGYEMAADCVENLEHL